MLVSKLIFFDDGVKINGAYYRDMLLTKKLLPAMREICPHAKTPSPPVLSPEVPATQALELLASVSPRAHVLDSEFVV